MFPLTRFVFVVLAGLLLAGCVQQAPEPTAPAATSPPSATAAETPVTARADAPSQTVTWAAVGSVVRQAEAQVPLSTAFSDTLPEVTQSAPERYYLESEGSLQFTAALAPMSKLSLASASFVAALKRIAFAQRFRKTLSLAAGRFDVTWVSLDADGHEIERVYASLSKTGKSKVCVSEKGGGEECVEPSKQEVDELWKALQSNAFDESVKALLPGFSLSRYLKAQKTGESSHASRACVSYLLSLTQEGLALLKQFGASKLTGFNATICLDKQYGFPLLTEVNSRLGSASERVSRFSDKGTPTSTPEATPTPTPAATPDPRFANRSSWENAFGAFFALEYYQPNKFLITGADYGVIRVWILRQAPLYLPTVGDALRPGTPIDDLKLSRDATLLYAVGGVNLAVLRFSPETGNLTGPLSRIAVRDVGSTIGKTRVLVAGSQDVFVYDRGRIVRVNVLDALSPRVIASYNKSGISIYSVGAVGNYLLVAVTNYTSTAGGVRYIPALLVLDRNLQLLSSVELPQLNASYAMDFSEPAVQGNTLYLAAAGLGEATGSQGVLEIDVSNSATPVVRNFAPLSRSLSSLSLVATPSKLYVQGDWYSGGRIEQLLAIATRSPSISAFQFYNITRAGRTGELIVDEQNSEFAGGAAAVSNTLGGTVLQLGAVQIYRRER